MTFPILETLEVPVDGTTVESNLTGQTGQQYIIRLSGTAIYGTSPPNPMTLTTDGVWSYYGPTATWIIYDPIRFQVNSSDVPNRDYNPDHAYEFEYEGNGQPFVFNLRDTYYGDNTGTLNVKIIAASPDESANDCNGDCEVGVNAGGAGSGNPVGLLHGEKWENIIDLSLNTPAVPLELRRSYREHKQSEFQFMGLGWTHNHHLTLTKITGSPNRLILHLREGGEAHFTETSANHYDGVPGVTSFVDWNAGMSQYSLTSPDQSIYVFDSNGNLLSKTWPSGEVWTYTYSSGKLSEIDDGYGRKLVFRYYSSGSFNGQLYRVGDHTFDDANPSSPTGRYVQYGYTLNKVVNSSGTIATGTGALLTSMRDVRGNTWTYDYYGQDTGETDKRLLNFLIERQSPSVDTTGDGTGDGSLTIEQVEYTLNETERAVNGGMEADSDWTAVGTPTTNARSTAQVDSATYARHVVTDAADEGIEGNAWDLAAHRRYIISARVYPVSGTVKMHVSGMSTFDKISSGTGAWETLYAVHIPSLAVSGCKLQFLASGSAAEFYVDTVSIAEVTVDTLHQERGNAALVADFTFQPSGENITTEEIAGKTTIHRFINGVYGGAEDPAGNLGFQVQNEQYRPTFQLDANGNSTQLAWSSDGKRLNGVTDALNHATTFHYNTSGASADTLDYSLDTDGRKTQYTYGDSSNPRLPTRIKVIDPEGTTVLRWQEFTYDAKGRTLTEKVIDPANGTTVQQQVTRAYYTSGDGNGLLHTVTQDDVGGSNDVVTTYTYDSAGRVIKTQQSSNFGSCDISFTVYDDAGNGVATICNYDPGMSADPTTAAQAVALYNASFPDKNRVTTYGYDTLGRRVETVVNAGAAFAVTTLTVYDALNRVIRTLGNYKPVAGVSNPYTAARSVFNGQHGTDNTENLVTDTAYNARGMVRKQIDVLDNVTLYGYDDAGRLVKAIQSASQPSYNNDYSGGSPDPTLGSYSATSTVDQDIVTTQAYDAAGNLVKTVDALGTVAYPVYDALNRPVKTVRAAKDAATISLNPGDMGYNAANDPRAASYTPSTSPDRDLIDSTEYDALGRVIRTQRLLENRPTDQKDTTLYGYDTLGRQVKVIRSASNPTYDLAADPDLSGYSASGNPDQDIVTKTVYDDKSRVLYAEDALGARTWMGYDGLGRQVKTIANAVGTATDGGVNDPRSGSYTPSSNPDKDLISTITYDSNGRVQSTQDVLSRVTRNVYDTLGRVVRTIANYVVQGSTDPKDWVWSSSNNRWEYGSSNTTPIDHDSANNPDVNIHENIISDTLYDAQGRVSQTFDNRHNTTLYLYDVLGRRIKTITNYVVQGASNPANWIWDSVDNRWEDGAGNAISFGTDKDQNRITTTTYDLAGRVTNTRDGAGIETRFQYDLLGRRTQTIANYVNGVFSSAAPDEDLISVTTYNKGGQVVTTTDARGTQTAFTYDKTGRRLTVTQAANNPLASVSYTGYDKAGRVLRSIQNWIDNGISPDAKTGSAWDFVPEHNGAYHDRNLITQFGYDLASRRTTVTDPLGTLTQTAYFKDGQVQSMTDPESVVSQYRYDGLRRRTRVVQGYVVQGASDPQDWAWDATDGRWEYPTNNPVAHGANNDQNIIVDVTYDKGGRVLSQREPRGNVTTYAYDGLDRRKSLTNPLSKVWSTAYADLTGGGARVTMTYPGITGAANYPVQRDFDRLGRPLSIAYGAPTVTPDVKFTYDNAGNRVKMSEYSGAGFTNRIRETTFGYDDVRRLTSAGFDTDGSGSVDETVSYEYDAGGLRTKLTLPGSLNVVYTYDQKGRLVSLTDWDNQPTQMAYDLAGRHIATERANGLRSRYEHDAAGRLKRLRHTKAFRTLAHFEYEVDKRGNRVQALEALANPTTTTDTTIAYNDKGILVSGSWSDVSSFKESTQFTAALKLLFLGDEATLSMGTGPDHAIYDVYVGGSLWQSFDGYAASAGQRDIVIPLGVDNRKLQGEGPHLVEIRNRAEKNKNATGYKVRFKQLLVVDRTWILQTVKYSYDQLSRLLEARYAPGANAAAVDADLLRRYLYGYDRAGNRLSQSIALNGGAPTVTNYTYNAANQLTSGGATYDNNGNLTSDGTNSYTWDRANRLVEWDNGVAADLTAYAYDGLSNRIAQSLGTTSPTITKYLLDLQPGLAVVLAETTGANVIRNVHAPRGIHAHKDAAGAWEWMVQDGLGSVRGVVDNAVGVLEIRNYDPYGVLFDVMGSNQTAYGFTGEPTDSNELVYLRNRYMSSVLGQFVSLDPAETPNRYAYVGGNPINRVDPSGLQDPYRQDGGIPDVYVGDVLVPEMGYEKVTLQTGEEIYLGRNRGISPDFPLPSGTTDVATVEIPGDPGPVIVNMPYDENIIDPDFIEQYFGGEVLEVWDSSGNPMHYQGGGGVHPLTGSGSTTVPQGTPLGQMLQQNHPELFPNPQDVNNPCPDKTKQQKRCDPQKVQQWIPTLEVKATPSKTNNDKYEIKHTGAFNYKIVASDGTFAWADGIRASDCRILDAKHVNDPKISPYVPGSNAFELTRQGTYAQEDGLFGRYAVVLDDPQIPLVGLEVITNETLSIPYWDDLISKHKILGKTVILPP